MREKAETREWLIITFHTTAEAMAVEKACRDSGLPGKLISAPRQLSSDCGIAWKCDILYRQTMVELLNAKRIEFEQIHEIVASPGA